MRAFFSDVAGAALPVAIVLVFLAAGGRAALAALDDERARRIAREHVEPLCTWSLVAALTYGVGLGVAAKASLPTLAVLLVLAAAAVLLRPTDEPEEVEAPAVAEHEEAPAVPPRPSLWSR